MKHRMKIAAAIVLLGAATITGAAFPEQGEGRHHASGIQQAQTTLKGQITAIDETDAQQKNTNGIHVTLLSGGKSYVIYVGPKWYMDRQSLQLKVGESIEVEGSKVPGGPVAAVIAHKITKNGKTVVLRDDSGRPVWAGKGR